MLRILCCLAAVASLQVGVPQSQSELSGRVEVLGETEPDLRGVAIILRTTGGTEVLSEAVRPDGTFRFAAVQPGRYRLSAEGGAVLAQEFGAHAPGRPGRELIVGATTPLPSVVMTLVRGAVLTGRVVTDAQSPARDINVAVTRVRDDWESLLHQEGDVTIARALPDRFSARTDSRGEFRVHSLPPGQYRLTWAGSRMDLTLLPSASQFVSLTHPGSVTEGQTVSGTIGGVDDVEGVWVRLSAAMPTPGALVSDEAVIEGRRFTFAALPPGRYAIEAETSPRAGQPRLWAHADITVGTAPIEDLFLALQPGVVVTVAVDVQAAVPAPVRGGVRLRQTDAMVRRDDVVVALSSDGTASVPGLRPGMYLVEFSADLAGQSQRLLRRLDLRDGQPRHITAVLSDQTLTGSLQWDEAAQGHIPSVLLFPADSDEWVWPSSMIRISRPDTDGRFRFTGMPAGRYLVSAFQETLIESGALADVLATLVPSAVRVDLAPGEHRTLDLRGTGTR